jgi:uncharacterized membrane-anchored protein
MISFADDSYRNLKAGKNKNNALMISNSGMILLAQIKLLLDKSLLENG